MRKLQYNFRHFNLDKGLFIKISDIFSHKKQQKKGEKRSPE